MLIQAMMRSLLVLCAATGVLRASSISVQLPNSNVEQLGYSTVYQFNTSAPNFNSTTEWTFWQSDCTPASRPTILPGNPLINYSIPGTVTVHGVFPPHISDRLLMGR